MAEYDYIATSTFGLESVVAEELKRLGYTDLRVENARVQFRGDELALCRTNLWLRTADRIRLKVGEFKAESFTELFDRTKDLPWDAFLPVDAKFPVDGKSVKSKLFSISDCQAIVKKAIVEKLKETYKQQWFEETGALYKIEVSLLKDVATITIDSSGAGLHKRGYRTLTGTAPLRETLAAALVLLSKWNEDTALVDPLCGTGTIPIEAALIGKNIAPGSKRSFVSEAWDLVPEKNWKRAREEAYDLQSNKKLTVIGTDIDDYSINLARKNAANFQLDKEIHFQALPLSELSSQKKYGKIICNPPYGERLSEKYQVEAIYKEMGRVFQRLDTWSYYILTAHEEFEHYFGKKATKKRKLYNGRIKVDFYQYFGPRPPKGPRREEDSEESRGHDAQQND